MKLAGPQRFNAQIYSEASEWLVEFRSGDIDGAARKAFYAWLRTSPQHIRAYLELASIWNEGSGLDPHRNYDLKEFVWDDVVIPLTGTKHPESAVKSTWTRTKLSWTASVAALLVAVGVWMAKGPTTYATDIGEQRSFTLTDGSTVELNTHSKIRVRFSRGRREIDLVEGEALFHVAKDPARPFVVQSGDTTVRAVGTDFDVYRKLSGTTVIVVEGRVAVREFLLDAGERAVLTAQTTLKSNVPDVAATTAWTHRRLIFQSAKLSAVAEEFNRYNSRQLVVSDPALAKFQITGVFNSTDPSSLVRFMKGRPDVAVMEDDNKIFLARKSH